MLNGTRLIFGKLSLVGKFEELVGSSFEISQENVGHDLFVMVLPGSKIRVGSMDTDSDSFTEFGRFDYTIYANMDDFNFIGFSSLGQKTHWIVEQS